MNQFQWPPRLIDHIKNNEKYKSFILLTELSIVEVQDSDCEQIDWLNDGEFSYTTNLYFFPAQMKLFSEISIDSFRKWFSRSIDDEDVFVSSSDKIHFTQEVTMQSEFMTNTIKSTLNTNTLNNRGYMWYSVASLVCYLNQVKIKKRYQSVCPVSSKIRAIINSLHICIPFATDCELNILNDEVNQLIEQRKRVLLLQSIVPTTVCSEEPTTTIPTQCGKKRRITPTLLSVKNNMN